MTPRELSYIRRSLDDTPVEDWLTDQWQAIEALQTSQAKQAARTRLARWAFYVWRMFLEISATWTPENLYQEFVEQVVAQDVQFGFISFNYDTFLDWAVKDVLGDDLMDLGSYKEANPVKPHGSINWIVPNRGTADEPRTDQWREVPDRLDYRARIMLAVGRMFNGPPISDSYPVLVIPPGHRALDANLYAPGVFRWVDDHYFYPLVMLPLTTKQYDFMPSLPDNMIKEAQDLLKQAKDVYVIGYRARDQIFSKMVESVPEGTRLHVVGLEAGLETAQGTADRILKQCPQMRPGKVYTKGFQGFVEAGSPSE